MVIPTRNRLHEMIDALPESQWEAAERALELLRLRALKPEDDEPWSDEDERALREAVADVGRGNVVSHEGVRLVLEPASRDGR